MNGIIFDLEHGSFVDGPGIRTTVFFKGCNLRCAWCHNPESRDFMPQMMYYQDKCVGCGMCTQVCPSSMKQCTLCGKCTFYCEREARKIVGKEVSADEIFREIANDKSFYRNSGGGATFSGGECMLQLDYLTELLKMCHAAGIQTAVDTAGDVPFSSFERILPYTDLFLYDVKVMDTAIHRQYTGVGNERILSNLAALQKTHKRIWVRVPVVPSVNDTEENILSMKAFLKRNGGVEKTELLPYHRMGENKHAALNDTVHPFEVPEKDRMDALRRLMETDIPPIVQP